MHPVHQRCQPVRPHRRVRGPVAQAVVKGGAAREPPVVEHETLGTQLGRYVDQRGQRVEVVVEVDRLPRVEHDGCGPGRMGRERPDVLVGRVRQSVEAARGRGHVHPGHRVRLALGEDHLARVQQLAGPDDGGAGAELLDCVPVVATPGEVDTEHLTLAVSEAGVTDHDQAGAVEDAHAAAVLPDPLPVREGTALGLPLAGPSPGEVEDLARAGRNGDDHVERVDHVGAAPTLVNRCRRRSPPPGTASASKHSSSPAALSVARTASESSSHRTEPGPNAVDQSLPGPSGPTRWPSSAGRPR